MTLLDYFDNYSPISHKTFFAFLVDMYENDMASIGISHAKAENESQELDTMLDLMFINTRGFKRVNKFFERVIGEEIPSNNSQFSSRLKLLNQMIHAKYFESWKRVYLALVESEYSPIENVFEDYSETFGTTDTSHSSINTDTTQTSDTDRNAFNSSSLKKDNKVTTNVTGDFSKNYSDGTLSKAGTNTHSRHGNVGVTTSNFLIESELSMRAKYQFYELIFNDIDNFILLQY